MANTALNTMGGNGLNALTKNKTMSHKETLEQYKELLNSYCYAVADVLIRQDMEGEYYVDVNLRNCVSVLGGYFDSDYVADELKKGEFPFDGIDKEGYWHYEFLLKYFKGDHFEEPSYLEIMLVEVHFMMSFEDHLKQMEDTIKFPF